MGPSFRQVEELDEPGIRDDLLAPVENARVVTARYDLLGEEFPELAALDRELPRAPARRHVDDWLIEHAALISIQQLGQRKVNTEIRTSSRRVVAYRPPRYGRAAVVPIARDGVRSGLLDLKGVGVGLGAEPTTERHGDGLQPLESALEDLLLEWVIQRIFELSGRPFVTVPTLAVLDLGFDVITADGSRLPAGIQVRRAHRRPPGNEEVPPAGSADACAKVEIEREIRRFGLCSCTHSGRVTIDDRDDRMIVCLGSNCVTHRDDRSREAVRRFTGAPPGFSCFEGINVQLARVDSARGGEIQMVDFSHFNFRESFAEPFGVFVEGPLPFPMSWDQIVRPDDARFVQPEPELLLDWRAGAGHRQPPYSWPWRGVGRKLVAAFRSGALDGDGIAAELDALIPSPVGRGDRR